MNSQKLLLTLALLLVATVMEVCGDAVIRIALREHSGVSAMRVGMFLLGTCLLFGYGSFVNLTPLEFGEISGLYIATLFIVWQVINFLVFRSLPSGPILAGGALIVIGGLITAFWKG